MLNSPKGEPRRGEEWPAGAYIDININIDMIGDIVTTLPLPVIIENSGDYIAGWCPILDVATQGKDEKEVKKNMEELIKWYFEDKDTPKPKIKTIMNLSISMTNIPVKIPKDAKCKNETTCSVCP